jgi:PTH1 family peptidyl-tRNA hydrolase
LTTTAENRWLIVGLGNPGPEYEFTRHNIGFLVIDAISELYHVAVKRSECRALVGKTVIEGAEAELVKPQTYMNLSGEAVGCLMGKPERLDSKLIVVVDDFALRFGTLRLRSKGSHGGHNGLRSIIAHLKTEDFIRVRVGIGPDHPISDPARFVLDRFSQVERAALNDVIDNATAAVTDIMRFGIEKAMAKWN